MKYMNKKGISPLIATVLIIGFTIVLAALVITWGTKLFKTTVSQTEITAKFSTACSTGLRIEATSQTKNSVVLRNNNQDQVIDKFTVVLNYANGTSLKGIITGVDGDKLEFPVPKTYTIVPDIDSGGKFDLYPMMTIDGTQKACESPVTVQVV